MNKHASMDTILNLFRLLFVVVVFFSVIFLARAFIVQNIDVFDIEAKILANRIAMSSELNYIDRETGRLYIGIVDMEKFTSEEFAKKLLDSIYYGKINSEAAAKITLKDLDEDPNYEVTYESFYNKELYDEKKVLVEAKLIGAGSAKKHSFNYYVLVKDNDEHRRGILNVDVILPNR